MLELATKFKPDEEEPFRVAVAAGYRCAELWTGPDVLADVAKVVALCRRFPLRYALHFPTRRDLTPRQLEAVVELYRALDCRSLTIHRPEHDLYAEELLSGDAGLVLAVENGALSPNELAAWAERNRYLTLDAEHVWMFSHEGASREEAVGAVSRLLTAHGAKLRHVHLPGHSGGPDEHRPMHEGWDYVRAVLDRLADVGYSGFVVSEVEQSYQTFEHLAKDRALFEAWLAERGGSRS